MNSPRVSIGLPVYNGERYLTEAIESVLSQTSPDWELIICDNASTDATGEIARRYVAQDSRIRYHRNAENLGASRNFNLTFELSRGEYFSWLAADDLIAPGFVERCVAALDRTPDAVLAYPMARGIDADGQPIAEMQHHVAMFSQKEPVQRFRAFREEADLRHGVRAWPMLYVFALIRSSALRRTRLIAPYINSDSCLVYELLFQGKFVEVPQYLKMFRHHAESYSWYARDNRTRQRFFNPGAGDFAAMVGHRRLHFEYLLAIARVRLTLGQRLGVLLHHFLWPLRRRRARDGWVAGVEMPSATT